MKVWVMRVWKMKVWGRVFDGSRASSNDVLEPCFSASVLLLESFTFPGSSTCPSSLSLTVDVSGKAGKDCDMVVRGSVL